MNACEFFIKAMSVLSIVSISTVTVSKEILCKSPVMHPTNVNKCLVDSINNHNYAHAEMDKKIIDKKKISIITGNSKNFPFLCKCIRYNYTDYGEYLCLYNKNQILLYSIEEEFCVYYRYDCEPVEPLYTVKDCYKSAKKGLYEAFSKKCKVEILDSRLIAVSENICTFSFAINAVGDKRIRVSVRRDTNNIILFDCLGAEDCLVN